MANVDLPQEILYEIFLRLPTKSVGKCKCLSTTWNAQLSTSEFIKLHQSHKPYQETIILNSLSGYLYKLSPPKNDNDNAWSHTLVLRTRWLKLCGSCNGLLLLLQNNRNLFVLNPVTRQKVHIPTPPSASGKDRIISYGFGYDCFSDDYKIVMLSCGKFDGGHTNVEVYCMKMRVWKTLHYPFDYTITCKRTFPFLHGALHWYARSVYPPESYVIVAFDLGTESFREVPIPEKMSERFYVNELAVLRGCLVNISNMDMDNGYTDVWVMNEYNVGDSWVTFYIHVYNMCFPGQPLRLADDEKIIGIVDSILNSECWGVCDFEDGMGKILVGSRQYVSFSDWVMIEESLVSPGQDAVSSSRSWNGLLKVEIMGIIIVIGSLIRWCLQRQKLP